MIVHFSQNNEPPRRIQISVSVDGGFLVVKFVDKNSNTFEIKFGFIGLFNLLKRLKKEKGTD
jgi:hypothetical protein